MEDPRRDTSVLAKSEIRDFTDLTVWKAARALRKNIYLVCRGFPKQETFELSSQMRRAAVSMTANLAEGYGRFSYQENMQFCRQSRGSVYDDGT
jgi:four helix bundle protein